MAEDAKIGSKTSSITRLAKNLPLDMAEDAKVGGNSNGNNDETVKKSPLSKKRNVPIGYFTSLCFEKRWVSLNSFWPLLKLLVKGIIRKTIKWNSGWAMQGFHPKLSFNFFKPNYVQSGSRPKLMLQLSPRTFHLSNLLPYSPSIFASLSGWENVFFLTTALVLQYVLN